MSAHHSQYQSAIARVRGKGSARSGTMHWWWQRLTAIALIPLGLWVMIQAFRIAGASYSELMLWFSSSVNAILLGAFLIAGFYHAMLGLQVVLEDYVHTPWVKLVSLIAVKLVGILLCMTGLFLIIRLVIAAQSGG
ncbi:MAG: succinate dehydrogenase, hydrophobic membrane anchor protein [Pseudomonadota bacterium]